MDRLIRGYREFRKSRWPEERTNYARMAKRGQRPEYLLIACSDSRSDPATVFSANPGELFVVRNVANLVPPYKPNDDYHGTSAAIEFAVMGLKVKHIVVMGHAQCGGVAAAMDDKVASSIPFLKEWVSLLRPAVEAKIAKGHGHGHGNSDAERAAVKLSIERLRGYPFIAEREKTGALHVDGLRFDISNGVLEVLDHETGEFEPVEKPRMFSWLFGGGNRRAASGGRRTVNTGDIREAAE